MLLAFSYCQLVKLVSIVSIVKLERLHSDGCD